MFVLEEALFQQRQGGVDLGQVDVEPERGTRDEGRIKRTDARDEATGLCSKITRTKNCVSSATLASSKSVYLTKQQKPEGACAFGSINSGPFHPKLVAAKKQHQ